MNQTELTLALAKIIHNNREGLSEEERNQLCVNPLSWDSLEEWEREDYLFQAKQQVHFLRYNGFLRL